MRLLTSIYRATPAAVAVALIAAPTANASTKYGPSMSAAQVRVMQSQGIREIIVERKPGATAAEQARVRARAGVTYVGPGALPGTELDRAPDGGLATAVAALERDPQVEYAEPNGEVHATSNDTYFSLQWALSNTGQYVYDTSGSAGDDIGAPYAWPHSVGAGVTVAVVDTGVDSTAPDLQGQLVAGYDFVGNDTNTTDQNGHGTHVSGIVAALQNNGIGVSGVAPGAKVMPLRVLDATGQGTFDNVATAFNYAGDHNIPIVNASLGGSAPSTTLEQAVANHPNTLYVVAAGNDDTNNDDPNTPFYPCDLPEPNLICVGASDQDDQPADFSDHGATSVDLFAPGVNILSTYTGGRYAYADGTSMATPMVTGTLALMLARNSSLGAAQLKSDLLTSVDQAPQLAGRSTSGGELDAAAAVAAAGGDAPYGAPGNIGRPQVAGAVSVGGTLSAIPGSWSRLPTSYGYQWRRCLFGVCLPLAGATSASYTVSSADLGASFDVVVTATNAAGSTQAVSGGTPTLGPPPQPPSPTNGGAGAPAPARGTQSGARAHSGAVRLTHVALIGRRGVQRGKTLVFTLSARVRVQVTLSGSGRGAHAPRDVIHLALAGRKGANRYTLSRLLHGRRLPRGRYALTVRAGTRAATVWLTVG